MAQVICATCGNKIDIQDGQNSVICPSCNNEIDCDSLYNAAMELMSNASNEAAYKEAAKAFENLGGYKDADTYRNNCLEQADICYKDSTFLRAKTEMMKGDKAGLSFAIHLLSSISGWKDADEQLSLCKLKLEFLEKRQVQSSDNHIYSDVNSGYVKKDRVGDGNTRVDKAGPDTMTFRPAKQVSQKPLRNQGPAHKPKNKKPKSKKSLTNLIVGLCVFAVLIAAGIAVYFLVVSPMLRYDEAIELIAAQKYDEGYLILEELGKTDEITADKLERAVKLNAEGSYDKAYALFSEIGDDEKICDSILERVSVLVTEKSYNKAYALVKENASLKGFDDKRYDKAAQLKNNGLFDEAYVLLTNLEIKDSQSIRREMINVSPELFFLEGKVGDKYKFGTYEIDANTANGKEKITWTVLDKVDNKLMLLCDDIIDCKPFNHAFDESLTWEVSSLRKVLNLSIYADAFTDKEKVVVLEETIPADKNASFNTNPGPDTKDYMFVLSASEVEKYLTTVEDRKVSSKRYETSPYGMNWWLRTPGASSGKVTFVDPSGNIRSEGGECTMPFLVRPAIWVKMP